MTEQHQTLQNFISDDLLIEEYKSLLLQYVRSSDIDENDDLLDKLDHIWYVRANDEQRALLIKNIPSYDEYDYNTYMKYRGNKDDIEEDNYSGTNCSPEG